MRFHSLDLENIKGLQGSYTLNFDALFGNAELFLIYGSTGSGKTSIFDSISLALFGKTPKLRGGHAGSSTDSISYIMNEESGVCRVRLVFSVLSLQHEPEYYSAEWVMRRAGKKKHGRIQAPVRSLDRLDSSYTKLETLYSGSGALKAQHAFEMVLRGLSFEDFVRTVLLPQGAFSAFIESNSKDRANILERITDTKVFSSISDHIKKTKSEKNADLSRIEEKARSLPTLTEVKEARILAQQVEKDIVDEQLIIDCIGRIEKYQLLLQQRQQGQQALLHNGQEIERYEKDIQTHQQVLEELQQQIKTAEQHREQVAQQENELHPLLHTLEVQIPQLSSSQQGQAFRDQQLQSVEKRLQRLQKNSLTGPTDLEVQRTKYRFVQAEKQLNNLIRPGENPTKRLQLRRQKLQEEKRELEKIHESIHVLEEQKKKTDKYVQRLVELKQKRTTQQEALHPLTQALHEYDQQLQGLGIDIELYQRSLRHYDLREQLKPEEPCVVCGSTTHPFAGLDVDEADSIRKRLQMKREEQKALQRKHKDCQNEIQQKERAIAGVQGSIDDGEQYCRAEKKKLQLLQENLRTMYADKGLEDQFDCEDQLQFRHTQLEQLEKIESEYQESQRQQRALLEKSQQSIIQQQQLEDLQKQKHEHEQAIAALQVVCHRQRKEIEDNVQQLVDKLHLSPSQVDVVALFRHCKVELQQRGSRADLSLEKLQQKKKLRQQQLATENTRLVALLTQQKRLQEQLMQGAAADSQVEIEHELERIAGGNLSLFPNDAAFHEKCQALCDNKPFIQQKWFEKKSILHNCQLQITKYEQNRDLIEDVAAKKKVFHSWNRLHKLVNTGLSFREFAQILQLRKLIEQANMQLDQIASDYRIAILHDDNNQPTLNFEVSKNSKGGRPLTTLSGGETFLVALAFALGLAQLRKVHMPIQTLLIDEGFGYLDQHNADAVVAGLESLKKRSIQVGLISHVAALQERVAARSDVASLKNQ